jgi:hypothetical protein
MCCVCFPNSYGQQFKCTCEDFKNRCKDLGLYCKHICAVARYYPEVRQYLQSPYFNEESQETMTTEEIKTNDVQLPSGDRIAFLATPIDAGTLIDVLSSFNESVQYGERLVVNTVTMNDTMTNEQHPVLVLTVVEGA